MHPLVIGHRGAPGYLPEHTRSSYQLAVSAGVGAVEPDVVVTRDGVLVVRHENEISSTTDIAGRPELAHLRRTKRIDGQSVTGWFAEDLSWAELSTVRCRERLPELRPASAAHDGQEPVLRLADLLALLADAGRPVGMVLEIKHPAYLASIGLDVVPLVASELARAGWTAPLIVESFEPTVLARLRERGLAATYVQLVEAEGSPADLGHRLGAEAPTYREMIAPSGLDRLADEVDGISLSKRLILAPDGWGRVTGPAGVVDDARARGLEVYAWTCRPENRFLARQFRRGGDPARHGDYAGEWAILRDAGLDGVFVDHPDLGVAFFGR